MTASIQLTQENIEDLLKGITIPSPPQIIADLQVEMSMPEPDLNAMATMIQRDPGLAGGILKTLNSPFYGGREIDSISRAVMLLGMNTVTNIINTLYLRESMSKSENISDEMYKAMMSFWDSATDVARACQLIAVRLRSTDPDRAYMLGLFHNVGIPLLMQRFNDYPKVLESSYQLHESRIVDTENREYSSNHAVISYYAARSWKLPEIICKVIASHHSVNEMFKRGPQQQPEEKTLLAILKLAENIAGLYRILGNNETDLEWEQSAEVILDFLGMSVFDYEELIDIAEENGIGHQSYFM